MAEVVYELKAYPRHDTLGGMSIFRPLSKDELTEITGMTKEDWEEYEGEGYFKNALFEYSWSQIWEESE